MPIPRRSGPRRLKRTALGLAMAVCMMAGQPALAQHGGGHGGTGHGGRGQGAYRGGDFHGRDYAHFRPRELEVWRSGGWRHEWHDGRFAWWWVVGDGWYFYPEPIYPYPTYVPPALIAQQAPPMPTGLPPMPTWYFCDDPQGYFPYVASCMVPWRAVPAMPPR